MNINAKKHPISAFDKEAAMSGVGANAIWNGPLDTTAYPKGPGYSAGKDGIKLRFDQPSYSAEPITQKAKARR
ncbi:MAG: hypothetical protein EBV27_06915 [Actinobacteria bacterium]|jgi:hypothetical protein|nr:hypothetical protein [Actinomycetota bacterium]